MHAIQLVAYGDPLTGLEHVELPEPKAPGKGEVLLQVHFSPLNISDLLLARGTYAVRPDTPAVIGNEGVATVLQVGEGVRTVSVDDIVLLPRGTFAWAQRVVAPAETLFALPYGIDMKQASMLSINPPTAALMLGRYVELNAGSWVLQNAANSGVGRAVIAFAKSKGIRTLNIVRRPELVAELTQLGADVVLVESENTVRDAKAVLGSAKVSLAMDAVGGESTATLAQILDVNGTILSYAGMSGPMVMISQFSLVASRTNLRGFYMYYPEHVSFLAHAIRESVKLVADGQLKLPYSATFHPRDIKDAVEHTNQGGKALLDFRAEA
jgi:NADPH:quinone reductase-like Zn-dependent oxidoreductase